MRISDWSSDVCSSDLLPPPGDCRGGQALLDVQSLGGRRFGGCLAAAVAVDLANPASLDLTQGVLVAARQRRELLAVVAIELTILVGELLVHAGFLRVHVSGCGIHAGEVGKIGRASGRERVGQYV